MLWRILLFTLMGMISTTTWAQKGVKVDVTLSPAGRYEAKTNEVQGSATQEADGSVKAENIIVNMNSITTGISLRDKHTRDRLDTKKFPQAKLLNASGKDGKGRALVEIRGIKKEVQGSYKVENGFLTASFPINIVELGITDAKYMGVGVKDIVTIHVTVPIAKGTKVK